MNALYFATLVSTLAWPTPSSDTLTLKPRHTSHVSHRVLLDEATADETLSGFVGGGDPDVYKLYTADILINGITTEVLFDTGSSDVVVNVSLSNCSTTINTKAYLSATISNVQCQNNQITIGSLSQRMSMAELVSVTNGASFENLVGLAYNGLSSESFPVVLNVLPSFSFYLARVDFKGASLKNGMLFPKSDLPNSNSLTLQGYNPALCSSSGCSWKTYPVQQMSNDYRHWALAAGVGVNDGTTSTMLTGLDIATPVDSGTTYILIPSSAWSTMLDKLKIRTYCGEAQQDYWVCPTENLTHLASLEVYVNAGDGSYDTYTIPPMDYVMPQEFQISGGAVTITYYSLAIGMSSESTLPILLGQTFMRAVGLTYFDSTTHSISLNCGGTVQASGAGTTQCGNVADSALPPTIQPPATLAPSRPPTQLGQTWAPTVSTAATRQTLSISFALLLAVFFCLA